MIVVLILSVCPTSLRGDVTKWLFMVETGVYVGAITSRVRDMLWDRVVRSIGSGHAVMVSAARNEQHFDVRTHNSNLSPVDYDGIILMMNRHSESNDSRN